MPVAITNRWSCKVIATVEDTDDLREAVTRLVRKGVSLRAANLRDSDLSDSDLSGSNLRDSNLSGSDLSGSNLSGSDLSGSNLSPIRDDFYAILSEAPAEVPALIDAMESGRVNGSTYSDGECGCLIGTLAMASGARPQDYYSCQSVHGLEGNSSRPAEVFFLGINRGDKPDTNHHSRIARDWAKEWLERMRKAFGQK